MLIFCLFGLINYFLYSLLTAPISLLFFCLLNSQQCDANTEIAPALSHLPVHNIFTTQRTTTALALTATATTTKTTTIWPTSVAKTPLIELKSVLSGLIGWQQVASWFGSAGSYTLNKNETSHKSKEFLLLVKISKLLFVLLFQSTDGSRPRPTDESSGYAENKWSSRAPASAG